MRILISPVGYKDWLTFVLMSSRNIPLNWLVFSSMLLTNLKLEKGSVIDSPPISLIPYLFVCFFILFCFSQFRFACVERSHSENGWYWNQWWSDTFSIGSYGWRRTAQSWGIVLRYMYMCVLLVVMEVLEFPWQ